MSTKTHPLTRGKKQQALALLQAARLDEAKALLEKICEMDRRDAEAWYLLGAIEHHYGRYEAAADCYEQVVALNPQNADAHYFLGNALRETNKTDEAADHYRQALAIRPDYVEAYCNLGMVLEQQKRYEQAAEHYRQAARIDPARAELHYNLGNTLKAMDQYADAEACYRRALELRPDQVDAHNNLGNVLADQGRFEEAIACYRRALELRPDQVDAHNNLGNVLADQGRFEEAIAYLKQAAISYPNQPDIHYNLGSLLRDCDQVTDAIAHYDRAMARRPDFVEAHWNRALALLLVGDFRRAWPDYEWKWKHDGKVRPIPPTPWDGSNLEGRAVFLHAEQGLGDELFFLRFAAELKRRGVGTITYRPGKKIASLLSRTTLIDRLAAADGLPAPSDMAFSVGDLPRLLGMERIEQIPPPLPLTPLPGQLETLRVRLAELGPPPYVGVTWRAGTKAENTRRRTLYKECPTQSLAQALKPLRCTALILQRHPAPGEIGVFAEALGRPVHDLSELNEDLEKMLALLALIDDYVGVSNTNMHLRTGVGKTAKVLVPAPPEWRWMAQGKESPWFPGFTVYRQGYDGNWEGAFDMLTADLQHAYGR